MAERVLRRYTKTPTEERSYYVEYADWFAGNPPDSPARTDSPATLDVTVPSGITKVTDGLSGTRGMVKLAGGTKGRSYLVKFALTTTSGEIREARISVTIEEPTS